MAQIGDNVTLPTFGNDWLEGCRDMYIIISLKLSTPDVTMFWKGGHVGYTDCIITAGRYEGDFVRRKPWYYNDGINAVAVPLTRDALSTLGLYPLTATYLFLDKFMNKAVTPETGRESGKTQ